MSLVIYCDESVSSGRYVSNFYGGVLLEARFADRINELLVEFADQQGLGAEIKWTKVSAGPYLDKYKAMMSAFFHHIRSGHLKVRVFFRHNTWEAATLSREQKARQFTLLYYQFLKHSFGLGEMRLEGPRIPIGLRLDRLPDKKENVRDFKAFLSQRSFHSCFINGDDIAEVDSKDHIILQCLDVVLGAMAFRLNEHHKDIPSGERRRGRKTVAKEALYRHIAAEVQSLYDHRFNFGASTGIKSPSEKWDSPYRHWSFVPKNARHRPELGKPKRKKPPSPT